MDMHKPGDAMDYLQRSLKINEKERSTGKKGESSVVMSLYEEAKMKGKVGMVYSDEFYVKVGDHLDFEGKSFLTF